MGSLKALLRNCFMTIAFALSAGNSSPRSLSAIPPAVAVQLAQTNTIPWIDSLLASSVTSSCDEITKGFQSCWHELTAPESPLHKGLKIVWITFPSKGAILQPSQAVFDSPWPITSSDFAGISGGFMDDHKQPKGWLVENSREIAPIEFWVDNVTKKRLGGIVFQEIEDGRIRIVPTEGFNTRLATVRSALQSKPILVLDNKIAVANFSEHPWNRTAIALDQANNVVLVAAHASDTYALEQYEFAYLLTKLRTPSPPIRVALALDGAFATSLYFRGKPWLGKASASTASVLRFSLQR